MLDLIRLHRTDLGAALTNGAVEQAAGHYWALVTNGAEVGIVEAARSAVGAAALGLRNEIGDRGDTAGATRLLALCYAISEDPVSLSRLLFDVQDRLSPQETRKLAAMLIATSAPSSLPYVMGFFEKTLAEHVLAGALPTDARRIANAQTNLLLDIALHQDPSLGDLRAERMARSTELFRYAAAIDDLRLLPPQMTKRKFIRDCIFFHLRHVGHPETRRAIDHVLEAPDPETPLVDLYQMLVAMMAVDESVKIAEALASTVPQYAIVRPLKEMADDLDLAPLASFGRAPQGRRLIYMNLVCWGRRYVDLTAETGLPSLLAPNNLPRLARENDLVLEFFTNESDLERTLAIPALRKLAEIAQIKIFGFPPEIESLQGKLPYVTFGYGSHATVFRAQRDGADLLFLISDIVWADGAFATIADHVTNEKRVIFCDGMNARASTVLPALEPYRSEDRSSLAIDAETLWGFAAPALMRRTREHFHDPRSTTAPTVPVRLTFQEADRLTVHSFHKLPIYVSHAAFKKIRFFQYTTPDGMLSSSIMDNVDYDQAMYFEAYDKILAIELSDDEGAVSETAEIDILESIKNYFRDRSFSERLYWNFEHGVRFPIVPEAGSPVVSAVEKETCLQAVRDLFATHPIFVDWGQERDRIRRLEFGDEATHWRLTSTEERKAC
jgi:hypothetical protein